MNILIFPMVIFQIVKKIFLKIIHTLCGSFFHAFAHLWCVQQMHDHL
jgi:hypothetical protein